MITVTKEMHVETAHLLSGYQGRCKNLHGHSYKIEVTATGKLLTEGEFEGMVLDFADLKKAMTTVIDPFDHAFVYRYNPQGAEAAIAATVSRLGLRTVEMAGPPTAEYMSQYFAEHIQDELPVGITVTAVRVWETATSFAEWRIDHV